MKLAQAQIMCLPPSIIFSILSLGSTLSQLADSLVLKEVRDWPLEEIPNLGLVSGVAVNSQGQPVIFHRGPRRIKPYDSKIFNATNHFLQADEGPINEDTVITLNPDTGSVMSSWGKGSFYFPHGIAVDHEDNVWLTDIALHQVFKFRSNSMTANLTLGRKLSPGSSLDQFCKPTAVVVSKEGNIFVADGYCNSRILQFDENGKFIRMFPDNIPGFHLDTPHGLTILQRSELLCIADRENHRIICIDQQFNPELFQFRRTVQKKDLGSVWAIDSRGDVLLALNGSLPFTETSGFIIDPISESISGTFNPISSKFHYAHDIAVSPEGNAAYVVEVGPSRIWKFEIS